MLFKMLLQIFDDVIRLEYRKLFNLTQINMVLRIFDKYFTKFNSKSVFYQGFTK